MAKIKDGMFGGFSGKIGNLIGMRYADGTFGIRSVPSVINNPQTPAQQTIRIGFGLCAGLFKVVSPFVEQGLKHVSGKKPRGAFISKNSRFALGGDYPDLHLDYRYLQVANGQLMPADQAAVEWNGQGNLEFFWSDNSGEGGANATDQVMLLVINPAKKDSRYVLKGSSRADGHQVVEIPSEYEGDELHAYIAFTAKNGKMVSDSVYVLS